MTAALCVAVVIHGASAARVAPDLAGVYIAQGTSERYSVTRWLRVRQSGRTAEVSLAASYGDGHGRAPEVEGDGTVDTDGVLRFRFSDSFHNEGTATFRREGRFYVLRVRPTSVVEQEALNMYMDPIRFRRSDRPYLRRSLTRRCS